MPAALRLAGETVEIHDDHFAPDEKDTDWLSVVGAHGWIACKKSTLTPIFERSSTPFLYNRVRFREELLAAAIPFGIDAGKGWFFDLPIDKHGRTTRMNKTRKRLETRKKIFTDKIVVLSVVLFLSLMVNNAFSETVYSNLGPNDNYSVSNGWQAAGYPFGPNELSLNRAFGFISTGNFILDSIELAVSDISFGVGQPDIDVAIYSNLEDFSGGRPDSILASTTITTPASVNCTPGAEGCSPFGQSLPALTTVVFSEQVMLNQGDKYWVGIHPAVPQPTDVVWWWNFFESGRTSLAWYSGSSVTPNEVLLGNGFKYSTVQIEGAYRVNASPVVPGLSIDVDSAQVWANGHEEAELTAIVRDPGGNGISGRSIQISIDLPNGVIIEPSGTAVTDDFGEAHFKVKSTEVGTATFTATDMEDATLTDAITIQFVKRRVVVFIQGINSNLSDENDQQIFQLLRNRLVALGFSRPAKGNRESSIDCVDIFDNDLDGVVNDGCPLILNYSYKGGFVSFDGIWRSFEYECGATAQRLSESIDLLDTMMTEFSAANPNTLFVLVGHSQGGFIAFQGLRAFESPGVKLDAIITLDGALGGTPFFETGIAANFTCWGDPAARNLRNVWRSGEHDRQGTTAQFGRQHLQNSELTVLAQSAGTRIMTLGNRDDCVFDPNRCGVLGWQNSSTQIVENADISEMLDLGGNCTNLLVCPSFSHLQILIDPQVINMVSTFISSPTQP